ALQNFFWRVSTSVLHYSDVHLCLYVLLHLVQLVSHHSSRNVSLNMDSCAQTPCWDSCATLLLRFGPPCVVKNEGYRNVSLRRAILSSVSLPPCRRYSRS
ncbi:unnamed protein product, partial [Ectocarpus sp. 8 AP-2014]